MLSVTQEKRDELIGKFWGSVRERLIEHHKRSEELADRGIGNYRHLIHRKGVGDLVYHQGVERTAEVIDGLLQHGVASSS
jgi:hypothetical protein